MADFGHPHQRGALVIGQVSGVLPQRLPAASEVPGIHAHLASASIVAGVAADLVQGAGGTGDDVEPVGTPNRVGGPPGDDCDDPVRGIGADVRDRGSLL